jgi:hypothetical protein
LNSVLGREIGEKDTLGFFIDDELDKELIKDLFSV